MIWRAILDLRAELAISAVFDGRIHTPAEWTAAADRATALFPFDRRLRAMADQMRREATRKE